RRKREIWAQQAKDEVRNAILAESKSLPQMRKDGARSGRATMQGIDGQGTSGHAGRGSLPPVIAWGSAAFSRKGFPPIPRRLLAEYLSRKALVVMTPERMTSQMCICDCKTDELIVSQA